MMRRGLLCSVLVGGLLAACSESGPQPATYLSLVEQERGVEPYATRMIATDRWLRIDDGEASRSFLLYDRRDHVIYSVNAVDARIIVMQPARAQASPPIKLENTVVREKDDVPPIDGRPVIHYRLLTNGKVCYDVFAAEGLVPQAHRALTELSQTLALEQIPTLAYTPKEFQTPCGLANTVFAPTRHLDQGFPVRWQDMNGKTSQLVDYRTGTAAPALFELPPSYERISMAEMRSAKPKVATPKESSPAQ